MFDVAAQHRTGNSAISPVTVFYPASCGGHHLLYAAVWANTAVASTLAGFTEIGHSAAGTNSITLLAKVVSDGTETSIAGVNGAATNLHGAIGEFVGADGTTPFVNVVTNSHAADTTVAAGIAITAAAGQYTMLVLGFNSTIASPTCDVGSVIISDSRIAVILNTSPATPTDTIVPSWVNSASSRWVGAAIAPGTATSVDGLVGLGCSVT